LEDDNYLEPIALICKGHSTEYFPDVIKRIQQSPLTPSGKKFRGKLLVALLLFADELDLHNNRVDFSKLGLFNLDNNSKLHFFRHHYIECIRIINQQINIRYKIHPNSKPYIDFLKKWIEDKLLKQLNIVEEIFRIESEGKISIIPKINSKISIDEFGTKREMEKRVVLFLNNKITEDFKKKDVFKKISYDKLLDLTINQHQIEIETISTKYIKTLFIPRRNSDDILKNFIDFLEGTEKYNSEIPNKNIEIEEYNSKIKKNNNKIIKKNPEKTKKELLEKGLLQKEKTLLKEKPIKNCLLIMGEAGIGKTNLLCYFTQKFEKDYPIIFLNGGRIILNDSQNIEYVITEYFNRISEIKFENALQEMHEIASRKGNKIIIFIDAINECINLDLIRIYLGAILNYYKEKNFAFVISCRDIDWRFFENEKAITENIYRSEENILEKDGSTYLKLLTDNEFKEAWKLYKNYFKLKGNISKDIINICKQPIMLRFFCEAYEGGKVPKKDIKRIEIFNNYWDKKLSGTGEKRETQAFLFKLVNEMMSHKKAELIEVEVEKVTQQKADKPYTTFSKVLSENIILYKELDKKTQEYKIGFTYEAFFEYVIARYILNIHSNLDSENLLIKFNELIEMVQGFRNLMGAIEYIILLLESATEEDSIEEIYVDMLEMLSTYKDKNLRNEAIIIIKKLKNILKSKDSLNILADDENSEINKEIYEIIKNNYTKFDSDFQKEILLILSTKGNNSFIHTPIEYILSSYYKLPPKIQELILFFSQCNFINTKRSLSTLISKYQNKLPINIYQNILVNLSKEKDNIIITNILNSLPYCLSKLEKKNIEIISNELIKIDNNLSILRKFFENNLHLIPENTIKNYIDQCIEEGDDLAKLQAIFIMNRIFKEKTVIDVKYYNSSIVKFLKDSDENISSVAEAYFKEELSLSQLRELKRKEIIEKLEENRFEKSSRSNRIYYRNDMPELRILIGKHNIRFEKKEQNKKWKLWKSYLLTRENEFAFMLLDQIIETKNIEY